MPASRLTLEIESDALQRLLENHALSLADFSCADPESKQLVQTIYRQLATTYMRDRQTGA